MAWPSVTFPMILTPETRQELEQLCALLQGYLAQQHKDDGSHGDITADSLEVSGNAEIGGDLTVEGDVTLGTVQSPLVVEAVSSVSNDADVVLIPVSTGGGNGRVTLRALGGVTLNDFFLDLLDGSGAARFRFNSRQNTLQLPSEAIGTGAVSGPGIIIDRNSSGSGAAGFLRLMNRDASSARSIWTDANGVLRRGDAAPTESGSVSDTSGDAFALTTGGSVSVPNATPTTLLSVTAAGCYHVYAYHPGASSIYLSAATVMSDGNGFYRITPDDGAGLALTLSGANVQATQSSGGSLTVVWSSIRQAQ